MHYHLLLSLNNCGNIEKKYAKLPNVIRMNPSSSFDSNRGIPPFCSKKIKYLIVESLTLYSTLYSKYYSVLNVIFSDLDLYLRRDTDHG